MKQPALLVYCFSTVYLRFFELPLQIIDLSLFLLNFTKQVFDLLLHLIVVSNFLVFLHDILLLSLASLLEGSLLLS